MYPKHENEGDLPFDTKEKMEIYHMPSIICLRLTNSSLHYSVCMKTNINEYVAPSHKVNIPRVSSSGCCISAVPHSSCQVGLD